MPTPWSNNNIIRTTLLILITLALVFGVVWLILQITTILFYFIIAAIISIIGKPICDFLEHFKIGKFKIPNALSSLITISVLFGIIFGIVKMFTPLVVEQTNNISNINTEQVAMGLQAQMEALDSLVVRFQDPNVPQQSVDQIINDNLKNWINVTSITHIFNNILGDSEILLLLYFPSLLFHFSFCGMKNYFIIS
ncbi:MAG: AI-2E family transporter [Bacteroidetes bacterium]|nr:AI-2E family transporter [Bacteroidota bacterium]